MVRRAFQNITPDNLRRIYLTYIRPHLEFASPAWSPYLRKDISLLEKAQRRITKLSPSLAQLSYEERLRKLDITTLEERRLRADLIEAFKILQHQYDNVLGDLLPLSPHTDLRGHELKIQHQRTKQLPRSNFFSCRITNAWNSLPKEIIGSDSLIKFKKRLDQYYKSKSVDNV